MDIDIKIYREKLEQFNSTEKYKRELDFLFKLIDPKDNEKIIDIGCGIGTALNYFKNKSNALWFGYDVVKYYQFALSKIPYRINKAYFMHSLSHIKEPDKLIYLIASRMMPKGEIIIITPNPNWILENKKQYYKPDETVIEHHDLGDIKEFLKNDFDIIVSGQFDSIQDDESNYNERIFIKARLK